MGAIKQICRLCIEDIPDNNYEDIDEINREILEILLINIDFGISGHSVVCSKCLEKIQSYFDFRSTCFFVEDYITPFVNADTKVDIRKVFEKVVSGENVNLENYKICRLCLSLIEDEDHTTDRKDEVFSEDVIVNCLPEVDLNIVAQPLICNTCQCKMISYHEFMKTCLEVEQRIKNYYALGHVVASTNTLFDLVKFKNWDMSSKMKSSEIENVGANVTNRQKNEGTGGIKCEEIDIKDELDRVDIGESNCSEDINSSAKNDSSKKKRKGTKTTNKKKKTPTFLCIKCPYSSNDSCTLKRHMLTHSDNEVLRCTLCSFVTRSRFSFNAHKSIHKGRTKAYGCRECIFETDHQPALQLHLKKHKYKGNKAPIKPVVKKEQCPLCPYKSEIKAYLVQHRRRVHSENVQMQKCKECSFVSRYRASLTRHQRTHTEPTKEIQIYRCEKCLYQCKKRGNLATHMMVHSNDRPFRCDECPYTCRSPTALSTHKLEHDKGDKPIFKCSQCFYVSTKRSLLLAHLVSHQEATIRCEQCDFKTRHKICLRRHMFRHDPSLKRPIYKCDKCPYSATRKSCVDMHQITHMELGETDVYKCATCDFRTKYKGSIKKHTRLCLKRKRQKEAHGSK